MLGLEMSELKISEKLIEKFFSLVTFALWLPFLYDSKTTTSCLF